MLHKKEVKGNERNIKSKNNAIIYSNSVVVMLVFSLGGGMKMLTKIWNIKEITLSECYHLNNFYDIEITVKNGKVIISQ